MGLLDTYPDRWLPIQSQARETISQELAQVDRGLSWLVTHSEAVGDTSVVTVLIRTPATTEYRVKFSVSADQLGSWTFEEDTTASVGSALTSLCLNRTVANDTLLPISHTPVLGTAGTVLDRGLSLQRPTGVNESTSWVLDESTDYVIRYTATTATTCIIRLTHEVVR